MQLFRMRLQKLWNFKLFILLGLSFLLFSLNLSEDMIFIGDQGWFYMSARDILMGRSFPLVGITSSHTWLHQGPLWTYLLSVTLWLGNYNPLAGGYLAVVIGMVTVAVVYVVGNRLFSEKIGMLAAILYATSPLIVLHSRMPYHTTPIPLVALVYFYSVVQWVKGRKRYFALVMITLTILYNLELAAVILFFHLFIVFLYGLWKKSSWVKTLTKAQVIQAGIAGGIIMLPIIVYDMSHGFKQTVIYAGWLVATALESVLSLGNSQPTSQWVNDFFYQSYEYVRRLLLITNGELAIVLFGLSLFIPMVILYRQYRIHQVKPELLLLSLWVFIGLVIYIVNKTPSEAYLPLFYPAIIFFLAITFDFFSKITPKLIVVMVSLIVLLNISSLLKHNYFMEEVGISFQERLYAIRLVSIQARHQSYQLVGKGHGSQYESFLAPYEYLGWYLGHTMSEKTKSESVFSIEERSGEVIITKVK